jgi:hypothetical protein
MTDSGKQLEAAVRELELKLKEVDNLDPESRRLLTEAVEEITAKLKASEKVPSSWSERLSARLADLEASHPGLATMLTRVCDFLDQAGI